MKKLILLLTLINFACFSMEKSIENQIAIFSNNSDQPIFLDNSAIEYSNLLKSFFESRTEYAPENIKINLAYEDLKNALNIINLFLQSKKDSSKEKLYLDTLQETTLQNLINNYYIADYFMINEIKEYLGSLFNKPEFIEPLSQLDKEQLQALEFIKTNNFLFSKKPEPLLNNVDLIKWSPDSSRYFIIFKDNTGQLFDKNGNSIGTALRDTFSVSWSQDGSRYFVKYKGNLGQLFDKDANSIGNILSDISSVYWSPDGSRYFVKYIGNLGQLFDKDTNSIGNPLSGIYTISWSPDCLYYFIINWDKSGQLFDNNGNDIGSPLRNIDEISWSPNGSQYFLKYIDKSAQLFDKYTNTIRSRLSNISGIYWSSNGSQYFVKFSDASLQLFDNNGNSIGNPLSGISEVYWSSNGSQYFLKYINNLGKIFDREDHSLEKTLYNIFWVYWSSDGSRYFVIFNNDSGRLFDKKGNSIGNPLRNIDDFSWFNGSSYLITFKKDDSNLQLFDKEGNSILNFSAATKLIPNNTLMLIDSNNNLYKNELKFLVKESQQGYQIYRAKDELPVGAPLQNKPLWLDTNTFKINENDQEQYYSYKELSLPNLVEYYITK